MSERAELLKSALLALPPGERVALADYLYDSVSDELFSPEEQSQVDATIRERFQEFQSGQDPGMLADDFFEQLRREREARKS